MSTLSKGYSEREGSEFQTYPGFSIEYRDSAHRYWGHISSERQPWVSVTSALAIVDKPQLRKWYGNQDATAVLDLERHGELVGIPTEQAIHVARQRGVGAEAQRDAGAQRGTAVHEALRLYCSEGRVPALSDFPETVKGYVQAMCAFLVEHEPEPILTEQIVGSPLYKYAGRMDLVCKLDGQRTLLDAKTGAGAHKFPDAHCQLVAYQGAMMECGLGGVDRMLVLALSEDGNYALADCRAEVQHFLYILNAHRAVNAVKAGLRAEEKRQQSLL